MGSGISPSHAAPAPCGKMALAMSAAYLKKPAFEEPHRCGELLVAALLNAFIEVWDQRLALLKKHNSGNFLNLNLVVENGAEAAEHLLTMAIRALDYNDVYWKQDPSHPSDLLPAAFFPLLPAEATTTIPALTARRAA